MWPLILQAAEACKLGKIWLCGEADRFQADEASVGALTVLPSMAVISPRTCERLVMISRPWTRLNQKELQSPHAHAACLPQAHHLRSFSC